MADRKPKLCLITTGGTIAMSRDGDGIARPQRDPHAHADLLRHLPGLAEQYDLDVVPLLNKDSANITPADWSTMAHAIHERWGGGYDGFVMTHGTDTMHYSAAAVALALGEVPLDKPVVFTGAMRTMDDASPDGPQNLVDACRIAALDFGEVLIVFNGRVLRGCRAMKQRSDDGLDAFYTPGLAALGEARICDGDFTATTPAAVGRASPQGRIPTLRADFASRVLPLMLSPGVEPFFAEHLLEMGAGMGVVLQGFGEGNVPDESPGAWDYGCAWEDQMQSWVEFIASATGQGVPVLLTSPLAGSGTDENIYGPGRAAIEAGAIVTGNMTPACAIVKFRWAMGVAQQRRCGEGVVAVVREMMQKIWVREMDPSAGA